MPSWDPRNLTWIKIDDFSPGIADRSFGVLGTIGPWPLGTATVADTFRCRALPSGALAPLPQRSSTAFTMAMPGNIKTGTPLLITGFLIQGRVDGSVRGGYDDANWITGVSYLKQTPGVGEYQQVRVFRNRMWTSGFPQDTVVSTQWDSVYFPYVYLESSRSATTGNETVPGVPVLLIAIRNGSFLGLGDPAGHWAMWPNPSTPTSNTELVLGTTYGPGPMVVYQGRSIICNWQDRNNGASNVVWRTNEDIYYTDSNQPTIENAGAAVTFTPEDPGEITGLCVSAANELLVLKHRQGGYVIRGDIVFPTVLRVPGIQGTGTISQQPLASPIGVIYASIGSGMYVWPGGETTECISDSIEPDDFKYTGPLDTQVDNFIPVAGRATFFEDLIFVPPGFVYNYTTKAWWKLEDTPNDTAAPYGYLYFQRSLVPNSVIACRGEQASGENFAFAYDFDNGQTTWQWRSHPIPASVDNTLQVREVVLRATGPADSTVVVTLLTEGVSEAHTFILTGSTYPRVLLDGSALIGTDIQIQINANSQSSAAAPTVYEVRLGYEEVNQLRTIDDV